MNQMSNKIVNLLLVEDDQVERAKFEKYIKTS